MYLHAGIVGSLQVGLNVANRINYGARSLAVAQALGHAHRLELLEHLAQRIRTVEELSARAHLTFANTSRHLQILRRARLVETERRGKHILYRLAGDAEVVTLIKALGRVGERNVAEIGRVVTDYFQARDALEPVSRDDLVTRLRDNLVTLLDLRPQDEFALGHLPRALNIPFAELERRLGELPHAWCYGGMLKDAILRGLRRAKEHAKGHGYAEGCPPLDLRPRRATVCPRPAYWP
jgi:DNA-binding transcriptional ArsR family regulator